MVGRGKGFSGKILKDTWTKPKRSRIKSGEWGWLEREEVVRGRCRQQYVTNNKKM